ncbi:MAG: hypothetical protein OET79_02020 [Nitrospirota bacterium]|nr:hypothetical protein [Nitrospirota bacterium]
MSTHWKKNFNYEYLGTYSLESGKDLILTIKGTSQKEVTGANGRKEICFAASFVEDYKPMILNRTNCKIIEKLYKSAFVEDWVGKKIQLYSKKVDAFGTTTDGLRIREFLPKEETESDKLKSALREIILNYNGIDKEDIVKSVVSAGDDVKKLKIQLKKLKK